MADEDPWGADEAEETTPKAASKSASKTGSKTASKPASKAASKAPSKQATPPAGGTGTVPGTPSGEALPEAEVPTQEEIKQRRPVTLYRHWVRPKFLQYKYMYDYRTNYYNDVIDYLDKRSRGVKVEVPRAQTWAERVLRTHTNPSALDYYKEQKKEDKHLIQTIAATIRTHNYHTKAYINRKYSKAL